MALSTLTFSNLERSKFIEILRFMSRKGVSIGPLLLLNNKRKPYTGMDRPIAVKFDLA